MATELNQAVNNAANDKSVQCLVITGNGRAFSSGGDVNEMGEHLPKAGDLFYDLTEQIHSIFSTILPSEYFLVLPQPSECFEPDFPKVPHIEKAEHGGEPSNISSSPFCIPAVSKKFLPVSCFISLDNI